MGTKVNIDDYYRIVSIQGNVIHAELKGFWSDKIVDEIGPEFLRIHEDAIKSLNGKRFVILADWSTCPVLGIRAIHYLTQAMMIVKDYHGYKVVEVIPSAVARLGVKTAADHTGKDDFRIVAESIDEGRRIVERLSRELLEA